MKTRLVSAHVDLETHKLIRIEAAKLDVSLSEYIRIVINQKISDEKGKKWIDCEYVLISLTKNFLGKLLKFL